MTAWILVMRNEKDLKIIQRLQRNGLSFKVRLILNHILGFICKNDIENFSDQIEEISKGKQFVANV